MHTHACAHTQTHLLEGQGRKRAGLTGVDHLPAELPHSLAHLRGQERAGVQPGSIYQFRAHQPPCPCPPPLPLLPLSATPITLLSLGFGSRGGVRLVGDDPLPAARRTRAKVPQIPRRHHPTPQPNICQSNVRASAVTVRASPDDSRSSPFPTRTHAFMVRTSRQETGDRRQSSDVCSCVLPVRRLTHS